MVLLGLVAIPVEHARSEMVIVVTGLWTRGGRFRGAVSERTVNEMHPTNLVVALAGPCDADETHSSGGSAMWR